MGEQTPKSKVFNPKADKKPKLELPQINIQWVGIILLIIIALKYQPNQPQQEQTTSLISQDIQISGKIVSKMINPSGGIKLIIDDVFHNQQYKVIISPDIALNTNLVVGEQVAVKAQPLGDNTFACTDTHKIQQLTQIVDFTSIEHVYVHHGVAKYPSGSHWAKITLDGVPDGNYSQIIFAQDSKGAIQVLSIH